MNLVEPAFLKLLLSSFFLSVMFLTVSVEVTTVFLSIKIFSVEVLITPSVSVWLKANGYSSDKRFSIKLKMCLLILWSQKGPSSQKTLFQGVLCFQFGSQNKYLRTAL